ncbi:recombinase family protein [Thermomicrobium sp. CFH 73360]|uniref:recombinase family protein n=1 Tax=Thermomicrobium sp. CFH 73360 TaxID=2951987 RepID=UPI002077679C|nr:recombinase family protein [Thermomicrobium sp. CFH 73360]MCM8746866.1 recombinase family protein [Thermomicrobium sp. CFH 73360]
MSGETAALFLSARVPSDPKEAKRRPAPEDELAEQERRLRNYAQQARYTVARVFREILPEFPEERPALKGLRTAMWLREIAVVLADSPERLYRDPERLKSFLIEARTLGLRVEFLDVPPLYAWIVKEYGWPRERR